MEMQPPPMSPQPEKKKLSQGCMMSLIVVGVLAVMFIALMVTCYVKRDSFVKGGIGMTIGSVRAELSKNPVPGVDTVQFAALATAFGQKLEAEEIDYNKVAEFSTAMQTVVQDKKLDSTEVILLSEAMITYFPDLASLRPQSPVDAATVPESSAATAPDSAIIPDSSAR